MPQYADWEQTIRFHGHVCPGVVIGHRACWYARQLLNLDNPSLAPEYIVIAENDLCGIDAVQINTGCTLGNDNLIIDNQGKQAFSFIEKKSGAGVRLMLKAPQWLSDEPIDLHHKVKLGTASPDEAREFFRQRGQRGEELLAMSDEELFIVEYINRKVPGKPRLHPIVYCSSCHEQVMEPWTTIRGAELLCPRCVK